jgi:hypothetical protein
MTDPAEVPWKRKDRVTKMKGTRDVASKLAVTSRKKRRVNVSKAVPKQPDILRVRELSMSLGISVSS